MKNILFTLALLVSFSSCEQTTEVYLKGKVKSVHTTFSSMESVINGSIYPEYSKVQYEKFDDKGNRIELENYNKDGSLDYIEKYKYDDKGNQIEMAFYNTNGKLVSTEIYEYEYDSKGNWIKMIHYDEEDNPFYIREREIKYYK